MKIIETGFKGLIVLKPVIHTDTRGYFFESFNHVNFQNAGISFNPVQDNESKSSKGVIRGLHYQLNPFPQSKLNTSFVKEKYSTWFWIYVKIR